MKIYLFCNNGIPYIYNNPIYKESYVKIIIDISNESFNYNAWMPVSQEHIKYLLKKYQINYIMYASNKEDDENHHLSTIYPCECILLNECGIFEKINFFNDILK